MNDKSRTKKLIKFEDSGFYFNDCEICKFMKEVERGEKVNTESELKKAFDRQNKKNELN